MTPLQLITTGDGSSSLLNTELNETYHSTHGALRESVHVFIEKGLHYAAQENTSRPLQILEIGFGTGLNAWLTCRESASKKISVAYTSLEVFPLEEEIWSQLHYAETPEDKSLFSTLHHSAWNEFVPIHSDFVLLKAQQSLLTIQLTPSTYDIVYFDAFAPSKQPEMWHVDILKNVYESMSDKSVFVTYCAKGQLKRDLKSIGFTVETLPGPPGKKEMVRAVKR